MGGSNFAAAFLLGRTGSVCCPSDGRRVVLASLGLDARRVSEVDQRGASWAQRFQQYVHRCKRSLVCCCTAMCVTCHQIRNVSWQLHRFATHEQQFHRDPALRANLTATWASPCDDSQYIWDDQKLKLSVCRNRWPPRPPPEPPVRRR